MLCSSHIKSEDPTCIAWDVEPIFFTDQVDSLVNLI